MKKRILLGLAVLSLATSSVFSATLYTIAPIGTGTTTTVLGMTPDGAYVVGQSGTTDGFLWDASTQSHGGAALTGGGIQAVSLTGVGYRTVNGNKELAVAGMSNATKPAVWAKVAGTWSNVYRASTTGSVNYNSLASTGADTDFYTSWKQTDTKLWLGKGTGNPGSVSYTQFIPTSKGYINAVSASGYAIGYYPETASGSDYKARKYNQSNGAVSTIPGISGSTADMGWGIDPTGTKTVGSSTLSGLWRPWVNDGTTTTALPVLPGSTGASHAYAISADGKYAVGVNVQTGTTERAVLWDMSNANSANWTIIDLTTTATNAGVLGDFSILSRATCIGKNAAGQLVVGGFGTTSSGQRGYVLTIPEPVTLSLLALGGLAMLRRRR